MAKANQVGNEATKAWAIMPEAPILSGMSDAHPRLGGTYARRLA